MVATLAECIVPIHTHQLTQLSTRYPECFLAALQNPPAPNNPMRMAARSLPSTRATPNDALTRSLEVSQQVRRPAVVVDALDGQAGLPWRGER
jgi:hypothetical protein